MGIASQPRPWIALSSSSGRTFESLWRALSIESQSSFRGLFIDRPCEAAARARTFLPAELVHEFERSNFEATFLNWFASQAMPEPLVLLCGFFGILSSAFLTSVGAPVVNTHPSLLPAFPGLDKRVHQQAYDTVAVSGFSCHLVNESLDGGPILFQHPVALDPRTDAATNRDRVREAEQTFLPHYLERILRSQISAADALRPSVDVRRDHNLYFETFAPHPPTKDFNV